MTSYYPYATPATMDSYNGALMGVTANWTIQFLAGVSDAAERTIAAWGEQVEAAIAQGYATCEQVNTYNDAARALYKQQYKLAKQLQEAGWKDVLWPVPLPVYGIKVTPWPIKGPDFVVDVGCSKWRNAMVGPEVKKFYREPGWLAWVLQQYEEFKEKHGDKSPTEELGSAQLVVYVGAALAFAVIGLTTAVVIRELKRSQVEEHKEKFNKLIVEGAAQAASRYNDCMDKMRVSALPLDQKIKAAKTCQDSAFYDPQNFAPPGGEWGFFKWALVIGGVGFAGWLTYKGVSAYQARRATRKMGRFYRDDTEDFDRL